MAGGRVVAVPDPSTAIAFGRQHDPHRAAPYDNAKVVNERTVDALPDELAEWPTLLRGFHERILHADARAARLYGRVHELERELDRRQRYIELLERARGRP